MHAVFVPGNLQGTQHTRGSEEPCFLFKFALKGFAQTRILWNSVQEMVEIFEKSIRLWKEMCSLDR